MKLIKTVVRANRVDDVREVLARLHVDSITVTEVRRPGQRTRPRVDAALSEVMLELLVRDEVVAEVIMTITRAARAEEIGDGHVSVFPLGQERSSLTDS